MDCYSYSEIVKKSFGKRGKYILDLMIFSSQYCFTISSIVFQVSSLRDLVILYYFGGKTQEEVEAKPIVSSSITLADIIDLWDIWTYGMVIIFILTMLSWVRQIAKFSFTFLFANILLLFSVITVIGFSLAHIYNQGGFGPGI